MILSLQDEAWSPPLTTLLEQSFLVPPDLRLTSCRPQFDKLFLIFSKFVLRNETTIVLAFVCSCGMCMRSLVCSFSNPTHTDRRKGGFATQKPYPASRTSLSAFPSSVFFFFSLFSAPRPAPSLSGCYAKAFSSLFHPPEEMKSHHHPGTQVGMSSHWQTVCYCWHCGGSMRCFLSSHTNPHRFWGEELTGLAVPSSFSRGRRRLFNFLPPLLFDFWLRPLFCVDTAHEAPWAFITPGLGLIHSEGSVHSKSN